MNYFEIVSSLRKSRKNIHRTKIELQQMQEQKFREIANYAYHYSAYYRRVFQQAGIYDRNLFTKPISDFPKLNKEEFLKNFDDIVTSNDLSMDSLRAFDGLELRKDKKYQDNYHLVHSSGSTGKPMYFVYDENAWNQMLIGIIRAALWDMSELEIIRLLLKGPKIAYIAATDGRYGGAMAVSGGVKSLKGKQLFLDIKTPLSEWIREIEAFKPNVIIGYPSAIKIVADLVAKGETQVNVSRVISCGEPLNINLRRYFSEVFCAKIINIYGASESLALGVETDESDGMYLFDDLNYIEVQDGEMYLTSLYNYTQPLIRYKITDQLTLKKVDQGFSKAEILLSRNEDLLWFEKSDGIEDFIHPLAIEGFCIEAMLDYQFVQDSNRSFTILVESALGADHDRIRSEFRMAMQEILDEKKLSNVKFAIKFVDRIEPNLISGKKQLIQKEYNLLSVEPEFSQSFHAEDRVYSK
ncbi:phenylacetate--CoA ligase family protein [Enterococcus pallens]|uniref:AMP-dependent synthetase/ligase domain-containing protein n=1 Tax=Enterococcus pallens ATCC BAA-351 TaxID=1158607 RepID=R2SMN3_9ENTE|nr:AMP-binding protein [Enterococcus pallens]EOH94151.1 hypothetical protein UAU_01886 [Enterococcus pallens ATCC BAA-351]EOU24030.1 hypothetical protein I588_00017 [Enterococcus pallens ATCC BAA-351]OJG76342.1 hypothetical protein RV10_GL003814 [Enterococcus pallens]